MHVFKGGYRIPSRRKPIKLHAVSRSKHAQVETNPSMSQ